MLCWSTLLNLYSLPGYTGPPVPSTQFKLSDKELHSLTVSQSHIVEASLRETTREFFFSLSADLVSVVEGVVGGVGVGEAGQVAGQVEIIVELASPSTS